MSVSNAQFEDNNQPEQSYFWLLVEMAYAWRHLAYWVVGITTVLSLIVALFLPNEYKATASVIPSRKDSLMGMFGATGATLGKLAKDLSPLIGGKASLAGEGYSYMAILNSRNAMERVVTKFNLIEKYEIENGSMEGAVKQLRANVSFDTDDFGAIQVTVYAKDPGLAADMANYLVAVLNELNGMLSGEDARNVRTIIEKRYVQNVKDLEQAEDSLKRFQEKYGLFSPSEQAKATISATAELESQMWLQEIKLGILENQMDESSQEVMNMKQQLNEIRKKLRGIYSGGPAGKDVSVIVPIQEVPEKTRMYLDLYRHVELQVGLMQYLYPMYEQAKLQEAKDAPPVLVLDRAVPPERKARPIRSMVVMSGFVLGAIVSFLICLVARANISVAVIEQGSVRRKLHVFSRTMYRFAKLPQ